jgi:NAD(P)-dependent dehydrogenase (short-subunit alcohol dehydrogenase family)
MTAPVAIVTGAGREGGIGRAIAATLLDRGYRVVVSDLVRPMGSHPDYEGAGAADLTDTAEALADRGEVEGVGCDVRDEQQVEALFDAALERFGRLDALINNAGVAIGLQHVVDLSLDDWQVNLDVMATGVFLCSRAAARRLVAQGEGGRIVTVASQAGKLGTAWLSAYSAAKFAAIGFTQSLAHELGEHGITVNAVCPGTVDTPMLRVQGGIFDTYTAATGLSLEQYRRRLMRSIPLRRFETPQDVANAVAFLLSPEASYITGEALNVTGGQTMH